MDREWINLGAQVCVKIKDKFYAHESWDKCYMKIAHDFTEIKKRARVYFSGKSETEMLKELAKYDHDDLKLLCMNFKDEADAKGTAMATEKPSMA